jgi:hypothetical protein
VAVNDLKDYQELSWGEQFIAGVWLVTSTTRPAAG